MIDKIPFTVSARTARLIGQENFSNAEGAIIELVKNCYDADSKAAIVIFDLLFEAVPHELNFRQYKEIVNASDLTFQNYYQQVDEKFVLIDGFSEEVLKDLHSKLIRLNSIYIIDNGEGMSEKTIREKWMKIGTDSKLLDFKSDKGRIKTGAKGLGRFALDRLGEFSEMKTKDKDQLGCRWVMNWKQFEEQDKVITDVLADLEVLSDFDIRDDLLLTFEDENIINAINDESIDFQHGTVIRISRLRDEWGSLNLQKLFKSLESLKPPKELGIFNIYLFQKGNSIEFGEVQNHYFSLYEYKVESEFVAEDLVVKMRIYRSELDVERTEEEFIEVFKTIESPHPYNFDSLLLDCISYEKEVPTMLKWKKEDSESYLKEVGDFKFNFYFTKLSSPGKEDFIVYPYIPRNYVPYSDSFAKFGGIKIYRDDFRVRPYGEPGDDWLDLGKRSAASPASAGQRIGHWKVRASQIAGAIDISRIANPELKDKSDRSSLIENTAFETFKKIITGIISEFEYDRSRILHPFFLKGKQDREARENAELHKKAEEIANEILEKGGSTENKSATTTLIEVKLKKFSDDATKEKIKEESDKDIELRLLRSLASLGLIIASFDHELKSISNNLQPRLKYLEKHLTTLIPKERLRALADNKNPFKLIEHIKGDHEKLKGWLDYAISSIKVDKRKRKNINIASYFDQFQNNWRFVIKERNVNLDFVGSKSRDNQIRAFEIDLDTIFNNLFTNSLESFKLRKERYKRTISISWKVVEDSLDVTYSDNGNGLSKVFLDPNEIFQPFITTKKDKRGNDIGTGLGMYLVKNVVDDYKASISLERLEPGLQIKITFKKVIKE